MEHSNSISRKYGIVNTDIRLRRFSPSDLDRIMEIEQASFTTDAYTRSRFESLYKRHPDGFIVAELSRKIIGYIIAYISDGLGDFDSMAVDPRYRHLGVGKRLVHFMIDNFRRQGIREASLEVRTTNISAISFYHRLGFRITKVIKGFYRGGGDACQMRRSI